MTNLTTESWVTEANKGVVLTWVAYCQLKSYWHQQVLFLVLGIDWANWKCVKQFKTILGFPLSFCDQIVVTLINIFSFIIPSSYAVGVWICACSHRAPSAAVWDKASCLTPDCAQTCPCVPPHSHYQSEATAAGRSTQLSSPLISTYFLQT